MLLTLFFLASVVAASALVLTALDVIRPPERVVGSLFFVLFLLMLLGVAWGGMLMLGAG